MAYNLPRLIRGAGIRRKVIVLRPQYVPLYEEASLAAICLAPVKVWEAGQSDLAAAYQGAISQMTRDSAEGDMSVAILTLDQRAQQAVVSVVPALEAWLAEFYTRHMRRFIANVKSATGVDPFPFIDINAAAEDIAIFQARMTSLISNIADQARKEVGEAIWQGIIDRKPYREVGKAIKERLGIARGRANFIASDQANKLNALLTEIRQEEAGITKFKWETAKDTRVRPEHAALQGKVYEWKKPPSVGLPGTPIRCRCTGAAYIDMDEDQ